MERIASLNWDRVGSFFINIGPIISQACALFAVFIFSGSTRLPDISEFASEWISATTLLLLAIVPSPATILCASLDLAGYVDLTAELLNAVMNLPETDASKSVVLPDKVCG